MFTTVKRGRMPWESRVVLRHSEVRNKQFLILNDHLPTLETLLFLKSL